MHYYGLGFKNRAHSNLDGKEWRSMGEFPKSPLAFNDQKHLYLPLRSTQFIDTNCFPIRGQRDFNLFLSVAVNQTLIEPTGHNAGLGPKIQSLFPFSSSSSVKRLFSSTFTLKGCCLFDNKDSGLVAHNQLCSYSLYKTLLLYISAN